MLSSDALDALRRDIDHIDLELLSLLAKRTLLCDQVGKHKLESGTVTRDLEREKDLIQKKIKLGKELGLNSYFVHAIFDLIIEQSVKRQYQMKVEADQNLPSVRVAFLGDQGSYSHQALLKYFSSYSSKANGMGYPTFKAIVDAVENGEMDFGILPIENTTSGSILEVFDLLQGTGIHIIGEEYLPIEHCLVGKERSKISSIKTVFGHPQALAQCSSLLSQHNEWEVKYVSSTAEAIEKVIKENTETNVAIANEFAAEMYQLQIVERQVANNKRNFTRFIIISNSPKLIPEEVPSKTSLSFVTGQQAGALASILNDLKDHQIVMTKLQSRPIPEMPWQEMFYVDVEGHISSPALSSALESIRRHCIDVTVLGCYQNAQIEKAKIANV